MKQTHAEQYEPPLIIKFTTLEQETHLSDELKHETKKEEIINEIPRTRSTTRQSIFSPRANELNINHVLENPERSDENGNMINQRRTGVFVVSAPSSSRSYRIFDLESPNKKKKEKKGRKCSFRNVLTHPYVLYSLLFLCIIIVITGIACFVKVMISMYGVSDNLEEQFKVELPQENFHSVIKIVPKADEYENVDKQEKFHLKFENGMGMISKEERHRIYCTNS